MGHAGEFEMLLMLAIMRLGEDAYGVTIREELENETSRVLTLGTVYKTLGRLEDKGHLQSCTSEPVPERGGRRKKLYELTPSGLTALQRSLADLASLTRGIEVELGQS